MAHISKSLLRAEVSRASIGERSERTLDSASTALRFSFGAWGVPTIVDAVYLPG